MPMHPEMAAYLQAFRRPDNIEELSTSISTETFISGIKGWSERTSTSPSHRHLGHYKCIITDESLASFHALLLQLPVQYGFSPRRWQQSACPLIEKDAGEPRLQRFCTIHILEADYQLFLKLLFAKRMQSAAETANALHLDQSGCRKRRTPCTTCFLTDSLEILFTSSG